MLRLVRVLRINVLVIFSSSSPSMSESAITHNYRQEVRRSTFLLNEFIKNINYLESIFDLQNKLFFTKSIRKT